MDQAQAALQDALRPASYLRDLHPSRAWREAAEQLHAAAAAALAALHGSAAARARLQATLAALQGEQQDGGGGGGRERRELLQRACTLLLHPVEQQQQRQQQQQQQRQQQQQQQRQQQQQQRQQQTAAAGSAAGPAQEPAAARLRRCLAAYDDLGTQAQQAPALVVTRAQLELLAAGTAGAPVPVLSGPPSSPDLQLELHPGCSITVRDYVRWTEEAWEAAAAGGGGGGGGGGAPAAVALTGPLLARLLQHHPHEGARAQLHAAGLAPRRAALLAALEEVVALRQARAAEAGWRSHAHLALQVGGACRAAARLALPRPRSPRLAPARLELPAPPSLPLTGLLRRHAGGGGSLPAGVPVGDAPLCSPGPAAAGCRAGGQAARQEGRQRGPRRRRRQQQRRRRAAAARLGPGLPHPAIRAAGAVRRGLA